MATQLDRQIILDIIGRIDEYQRELAKVPGVTERMAAQAAIKFQKPLIEAATKVANVQIKEAKRAGAAIVIETNKVGQSADKAAGFFGKFSKVAKDLNQSPLISNMETISALFIQVGGSVSQAAVVFTSLIRPVAVVSSLLSATGPLVFGAVALGASLLALVAPVKVMSLFAEGAIEARKRLEEMNKQIGAEQAVQLSAYTAQLDALAVTLDQMRVTFGSGFAENFAILTLNVRRLTEALDGNGATLEYNRRLILLITTLGLSEVLYAGARAATEQDRALVRMSGTLAELDRRTKAAGETAVEAGKEFQRLVDSFEFQGPINDPQARYDAMLRAAEKASKEAARIRDQMLAENERALREENAELAASLAEREKMLAANTAYQLKLFLGAGAQRLALQKASDAAFLEQMLRANAEQRAADMEAQRQKEDLVRIGTQAAFDVVNGYTAIIDQLLQNQVDGFTDQIGEAQSALSKIRQKEQSLQAELKALRQKGQTERLTLEEQARIAEIQSSLELLEARKKANREELKDSRQRARDIAKQQRVSALFNVGVNTAAAIAMAFAMFGPPPSPAGIAAAGAATANGILQAGLIAAKPLPTFFGGTASMPGKAGEVQATLHSGEAVLTSAAARDLGPTIIDALNAGLRPLSALGGSGDVILDGYAVGKVLARNARQGTSPLGQTMREGRQPVGYRDPYRSR